LVEGSGRAILFETGIGAFFPPKLRERFGVLEGEHVLLENLRRAGRTPEDIDVIVLSHLHFDHAGGVLHAHREGESPRLAFPRARFVVGRSAWERARHPHARDRASFIPELPGLLEASGRLELVAGGHSDVLGSAYHFHFSDGHTPGLMLAEIPSQDGPILFAGDLIPGKAWVHLPITMGYDRYPELLIDEKAALLASWVERNGRLFFTHDPALALARVVKRDDRFSVEEERSELDGISV
jgi:glyoxylase-like metal-dependent hydrolase (beta-lactamase superfamily II)